MSQSQAYSSNGQLDLNTHESAKVNFRPVEEKKKVVDACLGQSKREVEKTLFSKQSESAKFLHQEKIRHLPNDENEILFIANDETVQKLKLAKDLLGDLSLGTIFNLGLDLLISKERAKRGHSSKKRSEPLREDATTVSPKNRASEEFVNQKPVFKMPQTQPAEFTNELTAKQKNPRFTPTDLKRMIFQRSGGRCEYIDPQSKTRCTSRFRIQIDHIYPFALGGKTEFQSLRHLCFGHNQRSSMQWGFRDNRIFDKRETIAKNSFKH